MKAKKSEKRFLPGSGVKFESGNRKIILWINHRICYIISMKIPGQLAASPMPFA